MDRMRQALRIYGNMPFDARHFLACAIALLFSRIRILNALRVNDEK